MTDFAGTSPIRRAPDKLDAQPLGLLEALKTASGMAILAMVVWRQRRHHACHLNSKSADYF